FFGECKYHKQPVDADVYFDLKKKVESSSEIRNTYRGYEVVYGVFSKSGFSQRLLDIKEQSSNLVLVNEDRII
ncbi:MAG: ATP-binding protein, partial [Lachnospiraceae bacterium]|nr:ATP-binding protein [Lachnospiraceae bacterium]